MSKPKIADLEAFVESSHGYDSDFVYDFDQANGRDGMRALLVLARAVHEHYFTGGPLNKHLRTMPLLWEAHEALDWGD